MKIVGCDLHAKQQTIAMVDTETGEFTGKTLAHEEKTRCQSFTLALEGPVVVGIEATGAMQWFLQLLEELGIECRVGHPAKIGAKETRKQKYDRRDARLELGAAHGRSLPDHLDALQRAAGPTNVAAGSSSVGEGANASAEHAAGDRTQSRTAPWACSVEPIWARALQALALSRYTSQRRDELLHLYVQLQKRIKELDRQVEEEVKQRPQAMRLLTHPGVGPITALATDVFLGDAHRFATGNQVASYIGMIPCEHSSGKRQRLGKLSKQGNALLRYLWTEAVTCMRPQKDPELKRFYRRKLIQKGMGKARIAAARKLGIRLWIMMRDQIDYRRVLSPRKAAAERGSPCRYA